MEKDESKKEKWIKKWRGSKYVWVISDFNPFLARKWSNTYIKTKLDDYKIWFLHGGKKPK